MTELARHTPLEGRPERPDLGLAFDPLLHVVSVQLSEADAGTALEKALGFALPLPRTESHADLVGCAWLAPDEWLITGPETSIAALTPKIEIAVGDGLALVIDVTDQCAGFRLEGGHAREALAALCPLDFDDQAFPTGAAARSLLGEAGLFISRLDDRPTYRLIVDQTMARYAWRMLTNVAPDSFGARE